eukprot:2245081-Rhodomonas_salina.2
MHLWIKTRASVVPGYPVQQCQHRVTRYPGYKRYTCTRGTRVFKFRLARIPVVIHPKHESRMNTAGFPGGPEFRYPGTCTSEGLGIATQAGHGTPGVHVCRPGLLPLVPGTDIVSPPGYVPTNPSPGTPSRKHDRMSPGLDLASRISKVRPRQLTGLALDGDREAIAPGEASASLAHLTKTGGSALEQADVVYDGADGRVRGVDPVVFARPVAAVSLREMIYSVWSPRRVQALEHALLDREAVVATLPLVRQGGCAVEGEDAPQLWDLDVSSPTIFSSIAMDAAVNCHWGVQVADGAATEEGLNVVLLPAALLASR